MLRVYRALFLAGLQAAWAAAAASQGGSIGDFEVGDFAAYYVALTLVGQLTMAWNAYDFEYEVRNGRLSPKLLRPLHPLHYQIVDNVIWKIVTLPALLPALVLIGWTFHAHFQTQLWQAALFVPSVLLAAALRFLVSAVLATTAFWTTRVHAILSFNDRLGFLFSGQIAPLSLLPGGLQQAAYLIPFGYMLGAPAEILRGGPDPTAALGLVAGQAVWLGVIWLV